MSIPGYIALSRLAAQNRVTDVIANNLANADTPGFRASQAVFATYVARDGNAAGGDAVMAQDRATWRDMSQGPLQSTGNPLDLALSGDGFFVVETPRGERLSRAGRFSLSPQGTIVDAGGNPVLGEGGPLVLPAGSREVTVAGDGTVRSGDITLGRLRVVNVANPQALEAEGGRLFAVPDGVRLEPVERPAVVQGSLEGSNVRAISEMVRMMAELREFQFAAQFVEREGERLTSAVDRILRRR
jgi:flagellar basal-body rod protein FlgF